jgi:Mn-dependent DtxR family transcriptional regulator
MRSSIAQDMVAIRAALKQGGEKQTVSMAEAARRLKVSPARLAAMVVTGMIRVTRFERRHVVPIFELKRLRESFGRLD